MIEFIVKYWIEAAFIFTSSIIVSLYRKYKALNNGMQALLRSQLYKIYNEAIDNGYCPMHKKEQAEDIYLSYHELGANGIGTQVYNDIMLMPTKKPDSKE